MSDSLVNTDPEDVLSSVKRMVSEGGPESSEFIFIPTSTTRKPGRLVLTDALRVSDHPVHEDKPAPLKLTPQDIAEVEAPVAAANTRAEPMRLTPSESVQTEETPVAAEPEPDKSDPARSLSAKIEALEAAIARTEDQWEPDGESNDAYSGTRMRSVNWSIQDRFEDPEAPNAKPATFVRHPKEETVQSPAKAETQATVDLVDEEALRELIAQVVRDELQGALGERITRNLRKMVRREIYRALVTQKAE